jgi:predicted permease
MSARRMLAWWHAVTRRRRYEEELDAELAFHLDARAEHLVAQGMSAPEARRRARIDLGMSELHKDACREARGIALFDTAWRDLRYALRGLVRNPGYSLTALLVLTLALGANALLFTLYSAYALRSPPIAHVDRWVTLEAQGAKGERLAYWTIDEADALVEQPTAGLQSAYLVREARLTVSAEVTRRASGESVSDNYFDVLGVSAAQGRTFHAGGDEHRPVVLSHLGWQRLLAGSAEPLGRRIELAGEWFTVIGIMPPAFTGTEPLSAMYWLRDRDYRSLQPGFRADGMVVEVSGLRMPGTSLAAASSALTAWAQRWNPRREEWSRVAVADVSARRGYLPARDVRDLTLAALPVGFAFVLVLLVAAANLANLVLARFASRQRELALRVAIGAPRRRLVVQLLAECVLLASLAALLGSGLAFVLLQPVQAALYSVMDGAGFDLIPLVLDLRVLGYAWALALLAALAFGLLPALLATAPWRRGVARPDLSARHRASGTRMRSALMVAQLAASVVLLVLAGLVASNARIIERTELGFNPVRTIAVHAWPPTSALARELAALPQVDAVAGVSQVPLTGTSRRVDARIDGRSEPLHLRAADAAYFDMFGLGLLQGRTLHRGDESGAMVAVVSRRTAERLWPGQGALGRRMELPPQDRLGPIPAGTYEVVGVVEDAVSNWFIHGIDASAVYVPAAIGDPAIGSLVVRTHDSSPATTGAIMEACVRAASERNCELMPLVLAVKIQRLPFLAASTAATALGWIALAITCIGLYGLMSYLVVQKRREIGIRLALGAQGSPVVQAMLATAARQVGLGLMIGLPLAFACSQLVAAYTDSLRTFDLFAFSVVPLVLAGIALGAAWWPARRSARIPPTEALRQD